MRPEFAGLGPRFIRPIGSIHLTLGVMSLTEPSRLREAVDYFNGLDLAAMLLRVTGGHCDGNSSIWGAEGDAERSQQAQQPLRMKMTSLSTIYPEHSTSALFATPHVLPPHSPDALLDFCSELKSVFTSAGFLLPEPPHKRDLKLHATVLNTLYASNLKGHGGRRAKFSSPRKVDVRGFLQEWEDYEWLAGAEDGVPVEKVAICKMGACKIKNEKGQVIDEQYEELAARNLYG